MLFVILSFGIIALWNNVVGDHFVNGIRDNVTCVLV